MRNLFGINISLNDAYNDVKMFKEMEANKSHTNYIKYATTKRANLKRKERIRKTRRNK